MTEKYGFSVVAASSVTVRSSTAASNESCWVLLNRCTSSMNRMVGRPPARRSRRAASITARTSLTPADSADSATNRRSPAPAARCAMVVLPLPGGPHRITDIGAAPVTSCRSGAPGASRWSWPTSSSRVRGRIRTASGASGRVAAKPAPPAEPATPAMPPGAGPAASSSVKSPSASIPDETTDPAGGPASPPPAAGPYGTERREVQSEEHQAEQLEREPVEVARRLTDQLQDERDGEQHGRDDREHGFLPGGRWTTVEYPFSRIAKRRGGDHGGGRRAPV